MKEFQLFKESIKSDYQQIKNKVMLATDEFCERKDYSTQKRSEVYAELFSMELLERYHDWNSKN